jgi:hypothetical protein
VASSSAADENDMDKARQLGKAAMWVNLAGIILTVVIIIVVPLVVVFGIGVTASTAVGYGYGY